ncbi:hypothetical protein [Gymnodinialimonas sp.]
MTTAPFAINRRALMLDAWTNTHRMMTTLGYARHQMREVFAVELRKAWAAAKAATAALKAMAVQSTADLLAQITALQNKDTMGHDGIARLAQLESALDTAKKREAEKRKLIAAGAGRICTVTFTKKDGTARTMKVQPAAMAKRVKGDGATDAGKCAALTRKATHPNLMPVWDVEARAARSINLATITRIAAMGQIHRF